MAQAETQVPGPAQDSSRTKKLNTAIEEIEPQRVIIDTDLGSSVDDLFSLDFAARMHRAGKLNLMAVTMSGSPAWN